MRSALCFLPSENAPAVSTSSQVWEPCSPFIGGGMRILSGPNIPSLRESKISIMMETSQVQIRIWFAFTQSFSLQVKNESKQYDDNWHTGGDSSSIQASLESHGSIWTGRCLSLILSCHLGTSVILGILLPFVVCQVPCVLDPNSSAFLVMFSFWWSSS